jgi:hypothetical protein
MFLAGIRKPVTGRATGGTYSFQKPDQLLLIGDGGHTVQASNLMGVRVILVNSRDSVKLL